MLQPSTTDLSTTHSQYGRRFDEEFQREAAALASRPAAKQEPVARALGVSGYSVSRWKKLSGQAPAAASSSGVGVQELARRIKALARENADLRLAEGDLKESGRPCLGSPARRHGVIGSLAGEFPIKALCRVLGVSRRGYYGAPKKAQRPRARDNARLGAKIKPACEASRRTDGSPRLTGVLRRAGETCGRHRVARRMRVPRLRATQKRRFRPRTTDSRRLCPVAANHLAERASPPTPPGEGWQADITCVATEEGWLDVAGVIDACSRRVVGWAADAARPTGLVGCAFERAVRGCQATGGLLDHAGRGSQYAGDAYRQLLRRHGVTPSMSRPANCDDNARLESFWATMKSELIQDHLFATRAEARSAPLDYTEVFYNRRRLHSVRGFQSPVDYENNLS